MEPRPFERWCLDRRSAGERRLTPAERETLSRLARRLRLGLLLPWAGYAGYWLVLLSFVPSPDRSEWVRGLYALFMILGLLLLLPVAILLTWDDWQALRDVRLDLRADRVERFEPVESGSPPHVEGPVEVRHPSLRLLTAPRSEVGSVAPIREVAPGPIVGMRVRHPAEGLPEGARLERRHLSPEEHAELARAIEKVERLPAIEFVGAIWCLFCLWGWSESKGPRTFTMYLLLTQGLFSGGWFLYTVLRNRVLARRMRADIADGFALVFVPPEPDTREEEGLPHSGLPWRIAGLPAEWRGASLLESSRR